MGGWTRRRSRCSACSPRSARRCGRWARAPPGIETVFFLLVLGGRVYGPGFGFVLGSTTLFASAILTGGIGPWLPFQMLAASWVGLGAGLLPPARGRREIALLAAYGAVSAFALRDAAQPLVLAVHRRAPTPSSRTSRARRCVENLHRFLALHARDVDLGLGHGPRDHQRRRDRGARPRRAARAEAVGAPRRVQRTGVVRMTLFASVTRSSASAGSRARRR